jgi:hypothetical protein
MARSSPVRSTIPAGMLDLGLLVAAFTTIAATLLGLVVSSSDSRSCGSRLACCTWECNAARRATWMTPACGLAAIRRCRRRASRGCRHQAHRRSAEQARLSPVDPPILPRPCRVAKIIIPVRGPSRADRGRVKAGLARDGHSDRAGGRRASQARALQAQPDRGKFRR